MGAWARSRKIARGLHAVITAKQSQSDLRAWDCKQSDIKQRRRERSAQDSKWWRTVQRHDNTICPNWHHDNTTETTHSTRNRRPNNTTQPIHTTQCRRPNIEPVRRRPARGVSVKEASLARYHRHNIRDWRTRMKEVTTNNTTTRTVSTNTTTARLKHATQHSAQEPPTSQCERERETSTKYQSEGGHLDTIAQAQQTILTNQSQGHGRSVEQHHENTTSSNLYHENTTHPKPRRRKRKTQSSTWRYTDQLHNMTHRLRSNNSETITITMVQKNTRSPRTTTRDKDTLSQQQAAAKHATEQQYSSKRNGPSTSKKYSMLGRDSQESPSWRRSCKGIRRWARATNVLRAPELTGAGRRTHTYWSVETSTCKSEQTTKQKQSTPNTSEDTHPAIKTAEPVAQTPSPATKKTTTKPRTTQPRHCKQLFVPTLQRRRSHKSDRREQRSQSSDNKHRNTDEPQNSTDTTTNEKDSKKQSRSGGNKLNWDEHTIHTYQTHQDQAFNTTNPKTRTALNKTNSNTTTNRTTTTDLNDKLENIMTGSATQQSAPPKPTNPSEVGVHFSAFLQFFFNLAVIDTVMGHVNVHIDHHLTSCNASLYRASGEPTLVVDVCQSASRMRRNYGDAVAHHSTTKTKHEPAAAWSRAETALCVPKSKMPVWQAAQATVSVLPPQDSLRRAGLKGPRNARPNERSGGQHLTVLTLRYAHAKR